MVLHTVKNGICRFVRGDETMLHVIGSVVGLAAITCFMWFYWFKKKDKGKDVVDKEAKKEEVKDKEVKKEVKDIIGRAMTYRNTLLSMKILIILAIIFVWKQSEHCQLVEIQDKFKKRVEFKLMEPECFVNTNNTKIMMDKFKKGGKGVYYVLEGPHGSGKTTSILRAAEHVGHNVVYVSVVEGEDFGLALFNEFSIMNCEKYDPWTEILLNLLPISRRDCPETEGEKITLWQNLMKKALLQLRRDGKSTPVVIIDHLNLFSENNSESLGTLYKLQAFAKDMADRRLLTMVFALSERKVYLKLMEKRAKSRMVMVQPDSWEISKESAIEYLECLLYNSTVPKVDNITISRIIDTVGGYFAHILAATSIIDENWQGDSDEIVKKVKHQLFKSVISELDLLGVSSMVPTDRTDLLSRVTWSMATELINSLDEHISIGEANIIMDPLSEEGKKLQDTNIFYFDWVRGLVRFQWKLVQTYFTEKIGSNNTNIPN